MPAPAVLRTWSSSPPLPSSPARSTQVRRPPREVKMLAIATAALLAFSVTVEAASSKYDYGGREKYKHEHHGSYKPYYKHGAYEREHMRRYDHGREAYEAEDYHYDPFYESHFADRDYREPHHDSYDEDHYGGNAYFEELSRKSSPAKRYQRSVQDEMGVREDQVLVPFGGKVGKKLGKILHNPVLKKVSKKSTQDEGGAREGQFLGKGFGLGMLKRLGTQETKLHVHIHTGQGQGQVDDAITIKTTPTTTTPATTTTTRRPRNKRQAQDVPQCIACTHPIACRVCCNSR